MNLKTEKVLYELENGTTVLWVVAVSPNGHPIVGQPVVCKGEPTNEELELARQTTVLEAVKIYQFLEKEKETGVVLDGDKEYDV